MNVRIATFVTVMSLLLASQVAPLSVTAAASSIPSQAVSLALTIIPPKLPADVGTYPAVVVSLVDSNGLPSAALSDLTVFLTSSTIRIASVPASVTIPAGSEYAVADAVTTPLPGSATISASSNGLQSSYAQLTTATPSGFPSALQAYVAPPSTFVTSVGNSPILVIQLQDSNGNPARATVATDITVTSSNDSMVSGPIHLSVGVGADYVSTQLAASGWGQSVLTASSQGLSSSHVSLQLARSPLVVHLSAYIPKVTPYGTRTMYSNGTATMELSVSFLGLPVQNLTVDWTATRGTVSPNPTETRSSGTTSTTFTPSTTGVANITASASSPQTGPISQIYLITVIQTPTTNTTKTETSITTSTATVTSLTTTTVTTTTTASTFAYVALGATVIVILTVAALAAWVLRGRRP